MKPITLIRKLTGLTVMALLLASPGIAEADEEDDWEEARAASCADLIEGYKATAAAEAKVAAAISDSEAGTIATNVLGVASFAIAGIGFFTWDDNASAEENLADLRYDLEIIRTVAAEKQCKLP